MYFRVRLGQFKPLCMAIRKLNVVTILMTDTRTDLVVEVSELDGGVDQGSDFRSKLVKNGQFWPVPCP